jgi:indolepyruvate ferredoxin oxidoreductase
MNDATTRVVVNATSAPTADFVKNPDWQMPGSDLQQDIVAAASVQNVAFVDAGRIATALLGDAIATNMFMLGYAYQKGWVPITESSLLKAIELNGVSVTFNQKAFTWGRRAAADFKRVEKLANPGEVIAFSKSAAPTLDEIITRRAAFLTDYQDAAYAARYHSLVDRVRTAEQQKTGGTQLTETVARYFFKLLAYKDEYEVARLHTQPEFLQKIDAMFEGDYKIKFHLAPPLLNRPDPVTGEAKKSEFGPWMLPVFRLLAKLKGLRGTALDVFGYSEERRTERQLIVDYENTLAQVLPRLDRDTLATAVEIAAVPEHIRGYGHVKAKHLKLARQREAKLLAALAQPAAAKAA